jgi:hypothetical protein
MQVRDHLAKVTVVTNEIGMHTVLTGEFVDGVLLADVLWKKHLLSDLSQVFSSPKRDEERTLEMERDRLFQQIGQLQYELAWLKKELAWSVEQKRRAIERTSPD